MERLLWVWLGQVVLAFLGAWLGARWALSHERATRSESLQIEWLRSAIDAVRELIDEFDVSGIRALAPADLQQGALPYKKPARRVDRIVAEAESYLPTEAARRIWLCHALFELKLWDLEGFSDPDADTFDGPKAAELWSSSGKALQRLHETLIEALGALIEKPNPPWHVRIRSQGLALWAKTRRRLFGPGPHEKALAEAASGEPKAPAAR